MKNETVMVAGSRENDWWVYVGTRVVMEGLSPVEAAAIKKFADAIRPDFMIIEQAQYHDLEKYFKDEA